VRLSYWNADVVLDELARKVSPRVLEAPALVEPVRAELEEYFDGKRQAFDIPIDWSLAGGFTRRVLETTAQVPFGQVINYRDAATGAGSPGAVRAAGNALGANPMPIVIPCHRVIRSSGAMGGYTGGDEKKAFLLRLEGAHVR
jgi:methylated-DNA-[protein]-cysteine S-methyltransferase